MARTKRKKTEASTAFATILTKYIEYKEKQGITQKEVAKSLGMSPSMLFAYASDTQTPTIDIFYKACKAMNVSADFALGLSKVKSTDTKHKTASNHFGLDDVAAARLLEIKGTEEGEALQKLLAVDTFVSEYLADIAEAIALKKNLPADAKEQPKEYAAMQAVFGAIAKKTARLPDSNGQIKLSELETINYFIQCAANASQEIVKHIIDREGANNGEQ